MRNQYEWPNLALRYQEQKANKNDMVKDVKRLGYWIRKQVLEYK